MEYKSKRLHQLLESLLSDSELRSWTVHNNKFGTSVTIRFSNGRPSLQHDHGMQSTRETESVSESGENVGASSTQLFKPASKYTINRDKQRMNDFVERRNTRSQSRLKQCDSHELPRSNDNDLVATSHISPVAVEPEYENESDNQSEAHSTCNDGSDIDDVGLMSWRGLTFRPRTRPLERLMTTTNVHSNSDASDGHDSCDSDGSLNESSTNITDSYGTALGKAMGEAISKALKAEPWPWLEETETKTVQSSTSNGSVT